MQAKSGSRRYQFMGRRPPRGGVGRSERRLEATCPSDLDAPSQQPPAGLETGGRGARGVARTLRPALGSSEEALEGEPTRRETRERSEMSAHELAPFLSQLLGELDELDSHDL